MSECCGKEKRAAAKEFLAYLEDQLSFWRKQARGANDRAIVRKAVKRWRLRVSLVRGWIKRDKEEAKGVKT